MEQDPRLPDIPYKRSYSEREEEVSAFDKSEASGSLVTEPPPSGTQEYEQRPKRVKKIYTYEMELDAHEASAMATSNPLNRKKLRQQAKKGRKLLMKGAREEMAIDET